jgi:lipopolysaccharide export system protein LptA
MSARAPRPRRRLPLLVFAGWCALAMASPSASALEPAQAEDAIEIQADQGIEWRREDKIVFARGNARAVRGDLTVEARVLSARYRERADGTTEIWEVNADGDVRIASGAETLAGNRATFDLANNVLLLTGDRLRLVSGDSLITAEESMEYATRMRTLVASGNVYARQGEREVRAKTLKAFLRPENQSVKQNADEGASRLRRIEAAGNVRIVTPNDVMRSDQAFYDLDAGVAQLTGAVKITRGETQLNGCKGEIDLKTGVSRLLACGGTADSGRVRGLIAPGAIKKQ